MRFCFYLWLLFFVASAVTCYGPSTQEDFTKKGVDVPKTEMTLDHDAGELDLERIREAIAEANIVDADQWEEQERSTATASSVENAAINFNGSSEAEEDTSGALFSEEEVSEETDEGNGDYEPEDAETKGIAEPKPEDSIAAIKSPDKTMPGSNAEKDDEADKSKAPEKPKTAEPKPVLKEVKGSSREGKILVYGESGKLVPLKTHELRVVTYLQGARARTVVDYVFENTYSSTLQGTFYYSLPGGASPVGFAMFENSMPVDSAAMFKGKTLPALAHNTLQPENFKSFAPAQDQSGRDWRQHQIARVVEQKRARQVYEEVVRRSVDPALLEWSGGNTFKARVFPIGAHSFKRVVLVYEHTQIFDGQFLRYNYSLPENEFAVPVQFRLHVDTGLSTVHAISLSEKDLNNNPTHSENGWNVYDLTAADKESLSVVLKPKQGPNQILIGQDPGGMAGRTFYARLNLPVEKQKLQATGRALFIIDTSLSGESDQAYQLQSAMLGQLLKDQSISEYAVLLFDVRPRWLHSAKWRSYNAENVRATEEELKKIYLEGATNFDAVLADLEKNASWLRGAPVNAFLLSDGQITWGQIQPPALLKKHKNALNFRWVCYKFGESAANQALFDALTRDSGGLTVTVLSESETASAAKAHRQGSVLLKAIRIAGKKSADIVIAGSPKRLFPGQELQIAGRIIETGAARLEIVTQNGSEQKIHSIDIPEQSNHRFAARAFGELYVNHLLAIDDPRLDRMIVSLSQHYLLANARASMLILENEAAYQEFSIADEKVDLSNLEKLRIQESDQRLDKLLALDLDDAPAHARKLVRELKKIETNIYSGLKAQPLIENPWAGGQERLDAEIKYRDARKQDNMDVLVYDAIARTRGMVGDTMGAVRALSCTVELRPQDSEAMRFVGYALLALGQYQPATELFERVRLLRPFEGQAFLEEALALDGAGYLAEAAKRYEIILSRNWARHDQQVKTVAAYHYTRLLGHLSRQKEIAGELRQGLEKRRIELQETAGKSTIDYQLTVHWNTDSIDIDLWVIEPDNTKCYYSNPETPLGGKLHWDITDGLGPELYHMKKAGKGEYKVMTHYYGNNSPRFSVPTAILLIVDREVFAPEDRYTRRMQMRMLPNKEAVLLLREEQF